MDKVLVTGATGFIGYNIVELLLEKGMFLKLFIRKGTPFGNHKQIEYVYGDIRNISAINNAVKDCNTICHVAGLFSFDPKLKKEIYDINVNGTENICKVVLKKKIQRLIYTSSAATIGKEKAGLSNEESVFNLWNISSDYKKSKVLAEQIVLKYYKEQNLPVIILNPSLPIGKYDFKPTPTGAMVKRYVDNDKVVYTTGGFNFVNVKDVAQAHYLALQKGQFGQKYIIGNENLTLENFYTLLNKIGKTKKHSKVPFGLALFFAHLNKITSRLFGSKVTVTPEGLKLAKKKMFYNTQKSVNELGLQYTPIEEGIKESINWFKNSYNEN